MFSEPQVAAALVCGTIDLAITTLASLASLWAANPRVSWLARATPICLFIGLQFPIGCFDFALVFAMQGLLVVAACAVARHSAAASDDSTSGSATNRESAQATLPGRTFTLSRMFRALLLAGVVFLMMNWSPDEWDSFGWASFHLWKDIVLAGLALSLTTFAAWTFAVEGGRRRTLAALLAMGVAIVTARYGNDSYLMEFLLNAHVPWLVNSALVVGHVIVLSAVLALMSRAGLAWWNLGQELPPPGAVRRVASRFALVGLAVLLLTPAIDLYRALIPPGSLPPQKELETNGRLEIVKALGHLKWNSISNQDLDSASTGQKDTFVRENVATIAVIRTALRLPAARALDLRDAWATLRANLEVNSDLRQVAYIFEACGKHAEAAGDLDQATRYYVNLLQLGPVFARGGLAGDDMMTFGIEDVGIQGLVPLLPRLDNPSLERLQSEVREVQRAVEPVDAFLERERALYMFGMGYSGRLAAWLSDWRLGGGFNAAEDLPVIRADRDASLELLITECAIERFSRDHDRPPTALADLVPRYLPAVPLDPFDDQPLRYRRTDSGHLLYSIGRNYSDDGGVRSTQTRYEGDLRLRP